MNQLQGTVHSIKSQGDLVLIEAMFKHAHIHVLALKPLEGINQHKTVTLLFKEHSVILASIDSCLLNENVYQSKLLHIIKGDLLWQIFLEFEGHTISSILTAKAATKLMFQEQQDLLWCISPHEITLKDDSHDH